MQPNSTTGDFITILINCNEDYAIRCAGAKEFSVDPRARPCSLITSARRFFGVDSKSVTGCYPKGDWRLTWTEGEKKDRDLSKRSSSVQAAGLENQDTLSLRFVKKEAFPILARTLSSTSTAASQSSASSGEPQSKKLRTEKPEVEAAGESEASQGATSSVASTSSTEIIKGEMKAEGCNQGEAVTVMTGTKVRKVEMVEVRGTAEIIAPGKDSATIKRTSCATSMGGNAVPNTDEGRSTETASSCGESGTGNSAVEEGYGRQCDFGEMRRMNVGTLGFDLASSLGAIALFEGRISDAVRLLDRAAKLAYPKAIEPRVCAILAHCGGVTDTQPFETSTQAKALVAEMAREHGERFEQVVGAARNSEIAIFRALLHSLQASAGEKPLADKLMEPTYTALGAGRSRFGWRASAKKICNLIINASDGGMLIGRPFEPWIKAMMKSLENPDDHEFPRSFVDFKDKMKRILSVPPTCPPSFGELSVECSRRCRTRFDEFCSILEPMLS